MDFNKIVQKVRQHKAGTYCWYFELTKYTIVGELYCEDLGKINDIVIEPHCSIMIKIYKLMSI